MTQQTDKSDIGVDQLVELVEKAARTIERLQADKAELTAQLKQCEVEMTAKAEQLQASAARVEQLEQAEAELKNDADWCRWFRQKYSDSTFYTHIENAYRQERKLGAKDVGQGNDGSSQEVAKEGATAAAINASATAATSGPNVLAAA